MAACLLLLVLAMAAACGPIISFRDALLRLPPYERHVASLRDAGIDRTALGAAWIAAGQRVLQAPQPTAIPHRHAERFRHDTPSALAYRVELRRGQIYRLALESPVGSSVNLFVDIFRVGQDGALQRVAATGPPVRHVAFEPDDDQTFVVRIQPEFLAAGQIGIAHARRAALLFPVPGRGRRDVQSLFGASRSSGRREHQGIDIFAPRGTPVVAAADGWVSSTSPNELGGNVVWIWDSVRGHTLYYAHLDRHAVSRGQRVRKGDVVGFVGNTGNARTTAPHLHFGIYRRGRGAIDPLYYVVDPPS
jgi:murein DD-endopeptidase MepM/ murein hydrolase activator NlpD